jgi:hypothetical protein
MRAPRVASALALSAFALFSIPAAAKAPAKPAAGGKDLAFGCSATSSQLKSWQPSGVHVAGATRTKFLRLGSFTRSGADAASKRLCKTLPPVTAIIPGAGKGGVTKGDIVVAQQDVTVYRAWSKGPFSCAFTPPAGEFGGWWSLEPLGNKATYRKANAICPSWNDFTMKVSCTLKKGTAIIVGPTETASCTAGPHSCSSAPASFTVSYPRSTTAQVFINTRSPDRAKFLTNCHSGAW